jgi:adenylylsulfate reductase, subunit B
MCRGYADFAPLGHSVRVLREEEKGTISWRIKFRDGRVKDFVSPITTQPWGEKIPKLAGLPGAEQGSADSPAAVTSPSAQDRRRAAHDRQDPGSSREVYY